MWLVVTAALTGWSDKYRDFRARPTLTKTRLAQVSFLDTVIFLAPILLVWAYHEYALELNLLSAGLTAMVVMAYKISGKDKSAPIFTNWLTPGGSNPHSCLYSIERIELTSFNCNDCDCTNKKVKNDDQEDSSDS